jgi:phosphate-selective porin OprO/OprP
LSSFNVLNAFLNFNYYKQFQIRAGRFKAPFTYEWYKLNAWRFITPERSLFATNFGLNRMLGVMAWGELLEKRIEYAVGIFDGPRNSFQDFNTPKDVIAFLNFRPFDQTDGFLKNLNIGGSMDYGMQDNPALPAVLRVDTNASSETLNNTSVTSNASIPFLAWNNGVTERGVRELWELHLAHYWQGLSFISGWDSGVNSYAAARGPNVPISVQGFFAEAAYLITGETVNERTVVDPIRRFDLRPGKFGLGAIEPFARYSFLDVSNRVFTAGLADPNLWTNRVQLVDVGVNWYLNRAVKIYLDWEHAMYGQPIYASPGHFQTNSNLFWLRFQIYY